LSLYTKCIALFIILATSTAHSSYALSEKSMLEKSPKVPFALSYTQDELNFGNSLISVFTDLSKNKIDTKNVQFLVKSAHKQKTFSDLKTSIDRLHGLIEIKDQDSFYSTCEIKSKSVNEFTNSLDERINITIDTYCRNLYLKRMMTFSSTMNFSSRDLNFFKDAIGFYLNGESTSDLISFLKYYKVNTPEHDKLSNMIIDYIIESNSRLPSSILTNIRVSPKFNQYLQSRVNLDSSSLSYFQEEFQKTIRDLQDSIESGDFNQAKQLAIGATRFYNQNKAFISDKRAFVGFVISAKAYFYKGKLKEAIELFEQAKIVSPKEEFSEANFYLLWPYIVDRDFKGLKKAIEHYSMEKDFDKFESKVQYWIAVAENKMGDSKKAQNLFNKIISSSPYSFYSIMSLKELATNSKTKASEDEILAKLVSKNTPIDYPSTKYSDTLTNTLKRFAIWSKIGNERFQTLEIRKIQSLTKEETFNATTSIDKISKQNHVEFITLNLVRLLNSKNRYISAFKIFQDSVDQNSLTLNVKILKEIFPLNFFEIIKKNSINLDPLIVISLIRQESAFNPEALSGVGAKGLMQLMPMTAKRFNSKVKVKHLSNPEINVALGTKYLRQLIARFDGNLIYALASYNAGENRIDRWRREIFKSDDPLSTIESIPFEETRNYVKLIYRNYFFYNLIQNKSILKTPIEDSFKVNNYSKSI